MNVMHIRYEGLSPSWIGDAVSGQKGTLLCRFLLDEAWNNYPIRYMAVSRDGELFDPVLLNGNNEAVVPGKALSERCYLMIGVVGLGEKNGKITRYNGRPCRVKVDQGNLIWAPEEESEATAYEQLIARVAAIDETIAVMQKTLDAKIGAYQGTANAGRVMTVGEDGNVIPADLNEVYVLAEGETLADAPEEAEVVIDPNAEDEDDGGVEIDDTLTQEGKAADAKAVGDALADKVGTAELTTAVNDALAQAKESGEFDGAPGDDYVLTDADKTEIAQEAAALVDVALLDIIGTGEVTA